ncbi:MAG: hypothetical protein QG553_416 [Patescibacteria group bacterium]|nr:hypothetical protein [Patescibacteria group bacterium]
MWRLAGKLGFWLAYPLLWVYLRFGWRTRVLVIVDGEILLLRGWLGTGRWQLPGGGVHRGEPPAQAAQRELREETGIEVSAEQLQPLYSGRSSSHGLSFNFHAYVVELAAKPVVKRQAIEISESQWVKPTKVSEYSVTPDTNDCLDTWLQH